jgi:thymidylate synthase
MNKLDLDYQNLLKDILENGTKKETRNGGTISVFGRQIRHKMSDGFPLLTTKKMAWKTMVTELLWFLRGDTNIKFLVDNNCHIWDGDAYKNYEKWWKSYSPGGAPIPLSKEKFINKIKTDDEFAKKWGELGPIYGKQWRSWEYRKNYPNGSYTGVREEIDQIASSINLLKTDPDSRRNRVNAWNVGELDQMVLPPCHTDFQFFTRELSFEERCKIQIDKLDGMYSSEKDLFIHHSINAVKQIKMDENNIPKRAISLMWNQRSVDTFLGLPFNIASYGLLLEIIAKEVNMVPDELIGNLGDTHLYLNHLEQAKEQIGRKYTPDERSEMLKESMGYENYHNAIEELMPFGGGLSEYYEIHKIPHHTREPYPLPILKHMKTDEFYKSLGEDLSLITHLDNTDFVVENYQSHSSIKAPLSN